MDTVLVFIGCYIPGGTEPNLFVFRLDPGGGRLHEVGAVGDARNPAWFDFHPNGRFLYTVTDRAEIPADTTGAIATYSIGTEPATLTLRGQQATGGAKPCHVSVHPTGRYLLASNYHGGNALVMPIRPDFTVGEKTDLVRYKGKGPDPERQERPHAHSGVFSPDGAFAYVQDLGTDHIWQYRFDAERGRLLPLNPENVVIPPGSGPRHLVFHPQGRWAYLINELLNTITCLTLDAETGLLTPFGTVPALPAGFTGTSYCADIHLTPDGRFLYGSNRGHDSLVRCRCDPVSGRLTALGHHPTGGNFPRGFGIDPTGRCAVVANQNDDCVVVFAIDQETGELQHGGCRLSLPHPVCVKFLAAAS